MCKEGIEASPPTFATGLGHRSGGNAQVLKDFPGIHSYAGSDTIPGNKHIVSTQLTLITRDRH